jgi:hypothetical protein
MNDGDVIVIPDKVDVSDPNSAWFYFNEVTSGKAMIATGGSGAAALVPINPFYLAVRTSGQSAEGKVIRNNADLIFDKNFFYVNVNLDPPGGAHKTAEVSFISGSENKVHFSDGTNDNISNKLSFNGDEFYLSSDLEGKPVVNLEVFDKNQTFTGAITAEAFYLTPGSGGEVSKSGDDLYISSRDGQVVIDDQLLVTDKVEAEAFYISGIGEVNSLFQNIQVITSAVDLDEVGSKGSEFVDVSVPNVPLGTHVVSWAATTDATSMDDLIVQVMVVATDTVRVIMQNPTSGAINPAEITFEFLLATITAPT